MSRFMKPAIAAATVTVMAASLAIGPGGAVARATHHATADHPALLSCTGQRVQRPHGTFVFACGDGYELIAHTHWRSWGHEAALGTTNYANNRCEPACVDDSMVVHPDSQVRLYDVVQTARGPVFTRARITYHAGGRTYTVVDELRG